MSSSTSLKSDALFNVQGMVAVITGGATGIGLMMTKALIENGASRIYILARRQDKLDEVEALAPKTVVGIQCDVTSVDSLKAAAEKIRQETGHINLLVANSGALGPRIFENVDPRDPNTSIADIQKAVLSHGADEIQDVFAVNVTGVYYTVFAFVDLLDAGNRVKNYGEGKIKSQIIMIGSVAGFLKGGAGGFAYGVSKCAVTHLGKMLAAFLVPWSIRCNIIAPGVFPSDLAQSAGLLSQTEEGSIDRSVIPAQRLGTEFDMGGTILYLSSRADPLRQLVDWTGRRSFPRRGPASTRSNKRSFDGNRVDQLRYGELFGRSGDNPNPSVPSLSSTSPSLTVAPATPTAPAAPLYDRPALPFNPNVAIQARNIVNILLVIPFVDNGAKYDAAEVQECKSPDGTMIGKGIAKRRYMAIMKVEEDHLICLPVYSHNRLGVDTLTARTAWNYVPTQFNTGFSVNVPSNWAGWDSVRYRMHGAHKQMAGKSLIWLPAVYAYRFEKEETIKAIGEVSPEGFHRLKEIYTKDMADR